MSRIEKIIAVVSLIIFCASLFGIFGYEKLFKNNKDKHVIARIESVSENGRVKSNDSHKYREIKENDAIVNGDNIISGKNSKILVKFVNGPRLMIGEESLISLREVDGQPDLKIEKGSFSGTFEEGDMLDVLTNNEVITLNGDKDTQFSIAQSEIGETEIGSYDKELNVEYRGEKFSLKNEKAAVSLKRGFTTKKSFSQNGDSTANSGSNDAQQVNDIEIDNSVQKQGLSLEPPYPKEDQMFLHNNGGTIPIYPKTKCKGPCELAISLNGKKTIKKVFARDVIPLVYLDVQANTQARVNWKFSDGGDELEGTFEILKNNSENFQKAFDKKIPVEIMN